MEGSIFVRVLRVKGEAEKKPRDVLGGGDKDRVAPCGCLALAYS